MILASGLNELMRVAKKYGIRVSITDQTFLSDETIDGNPFIDTGSEFTRNMITSVKSSTL